MTGEELFAIWSAAGEAGGTSIGPWEEMLPVYRAVWDEFARGVDARLTSELDPLIEHWRVLASEAAARIDNTVSHSVRKDARRDLLVARCYVDAYQSVRVNMTGEKLPEPS